ncbi:hypothetical protein CANINC_003565 [Pichia inconspicua]|uniref:MATE efflux family protein n=1 Tax=Pichia inconspicua TaxID=52247 RepID=A0A4T0WYC0_9ASCO|nr:hypothetical protein CANINC_003565 [[Candida] inconspicua]
MPEEFQKIVADSPHSLLYGSEESLSSDINNESSHIELTPVTTTTLKEFKYLCTNSIPLFFTFFIQYMVQILIPTYFASQLGPVYMSATTLSITTFYLTGPVLINGFTSALDTLCSTAFGAKHYHKVGTYYIQCTILMIFLFIPSMVFWSNANDFFVKITTFTHPDDHELADLCTNFLSTLTFVAPAVVIFECTKRFLQSQCKFSVPTRVVTLGIPTSICFNILFKAIIPTESCITAPAISFVFTYWLMTICLVSYALLIDGYQCLPKIDEMKKWTFTNFSKNIRIFFSLGIPGVLMILSEAFAFQIITFCSTNFPKDQLAAQSIVSTLASLAFQPPYAVGICCSTHIANIIGSKSSNYKVIMKAVYLLMITLSIFNFTWCFFLGTNIATLFTADPVILKTTSKLIKLIALNQFLDCFNILCAAIFRGQGRQNIGSTLSVIAYYAVGVPLEIYLGFKLNLQVFGLWIGLAIAVNFLSVAELIIVYKSNWINIIKKSNQIA